MAGLDPAIHALFSNPHGNREGAQSPARLGLYLGIADFAPPIILNRQQ
jgi:hypothetical protein